MGAKTPTGQNPAIIAGYSFWRASRESGVPGLGAQQRRPPRCEIQLCHGAEAFEAFGLTLLERQGQFHLTLPLSEERRACCQKGRASRTGRQGHEGEQELSGSGLAI